jgi:ribosome-binding factor A
MSNRIEKVNSLLEHEIAEILQREINLPNDVLVTLTRVSATANLIEAKAFVSVFTSPKSADEGGLADKVLKILNSQVFAVQQKINKKLNMRPIPKIIFVIDKNEAEAGRIDEILGKLKKEEK